MKSILVVEDSPMVTKVIRYVLSQSPFIRVSYAASFEQARTLVEKNEADPFFAALVDLSLPDAPAGEVVDYTLGKKIPTIVLTASFDEKKRETMLAKGIVDYVTKEGRYSYEVALSTIHRLIKNTEVKVLVADDSSMQRKLLRKLLTLHMYQVLEASDGVEAIKVVLENPDIQLLITDYNMPRMDGYELIKNLRMKYEKTSLIIIGISSETDGSLSAKFIKTGANDFLKKPFNHEEFFCRINHSVETIELINTIRDAANRDEMTGIYSRRYFFNVGEKAFDQARQDSVPLSVAVIDLQRYININTEHGNDVGDQLMIYVARRLDSVFDRFVVARADGQEFYVLLPGLDNEKAVAYVERIREMISNESFRIEDKLLSITFTAGVSNIPGANLDEQVCSAYDCLHRAKDAGGDLVFGD